MTPFLNRITPVKDQKRLKRIEMYIRESLLAYPSSQHGYILLSVDLYLTCVKNIVWVEITPVFRP